MERGTPEYEALSAVEKMKVDDAVSEQKREEVDLTDASKDRLKNFITAAGDSAETAILIYNDMLNAGGEIAESAGGAIVLIQTRWSEKDMTGNLIRQMTKDPFADQWEVVELPAIFESGEPCWPEFWKKEELESVKASIPAYQWNAQYQQNPTSETLAILKREWWNVWEKDHIPNLQYVIQSYDTAFSKRETADYNGIYR